MSEISTQHYLLITNRPIAGMFATFIQVLGELLYCEQNSITPVIFFGSNWVYWQKGGYQNALNGWEYYFYPVSSGNINRLTGQSDEYLQYCNIFDYDNTQIIFNKNPKHVYDLSRAGHLRLPKNVTVVNRWPEFNLGVRTFLEENRETACRLVRDYIKVKPHVLDKVNDFYERKMSSFAVVGVHFRGPSHNGEIEGWHKLAYADEKYYFREVDDYLKRVSEARILIVTDIKEAVDCFVTRYGNRCIYLNVTRSTAQQKAPCHEYGGAIVGEEVLVEALCLARCDHLIHGISNVAYGVLCFNKSLSHIDIYQKNENELRRLFLDQ